MTAAYASWRVVALAALALALMVPVTLPVPVLRELVQERFGVSELLTSLFMSLNMVGAVLAAPLAGALADRFGRRPLLVSAALAVDALCFFGLTRDVAFPLFLAIRFVEGCAHIVALSLLLALASQCRGPRARGRVMGGVGGAMMLGVAVGAPLGGWLGREDAILPLQVGAAMLVMTALVAAAVLRELPSGGPERPGLAEVLALVRRNRTLRIPLAFAFADRFTVGFYTTTFSLYLQRIHDLPPGRIGLLIMVFMLPFALLSAPMGLASERVSRAALLCGGSLLYGIGTAAVAWATPAQLPALMFAVGVTAAAMFVPSLIFTTELAPAEARTTAMGAFNAAGSLGFILGPLTGGLVSQVVAGFAGWQAGYRAAFAVAGASELLLALAFFLPLRRIERER